MKRRAWFIPFQGCSRRCVYCDQEAITGVREAPTPQQIADALAEEHDPVEVCFFGGSFARLPGRLLSQYLAAASCNGGNRISFSSYPGDFCGREGEERIKLLRDYPIGTIELGTPSLDPIVLKAAARDDDPALILETLHRLKEEGFRLGLQMMIGLPSQTLASCLSDLAVLADIKKELVWDLRIYPCLVLRGTKLQLLFEAQSYTPLTLCEAAQESGSLLLKAEELAFSVIRIGLQEGEELRGSVLAGPYHPAFGELARGEALVQRLLSINPSGPWLLAERDVSLLRGHGRYGLRRLAEQAGVSTEQAWHNIVRAADRD